jgi:site-specific DNA recombinase
MKRPALQALLADIGAGRIDVVVVYKVDRLTRSLTDFAKIVEVFDAHGVSFVSITQQFNTTSSMGRLTLNVLLSFAQSNARSLASASAIRSRHPRRKDSGWVASCPLVTAPTIGRLSSTNPRQTKFARSSAFT